MLKVIVDTNIFVAGYLSKTKDGYPAMILELWRTGCFTLVMSPQMLEELIAKLIEKKIPTSHLEDLVTTLATIALYIHGAYQTCRLDDINVSDNKFLAAAYESSADYIVSYDTKSLLPLKHFYGTPILRPELFVRQFINRAKQ